MLIPFYILFCTYIIEARILIKHGSMAPINPGDVGMIFYITLENKDKCKYDIFLEMEECCETIQNNGIDCNFMQLLGGDMGVLSPLCTKNITMLYPNMYLINRKGKCQINVVSKNEQGQSYKTSCSISFNTTLNPKQTFGGEIRTCATADLDPLDNCQPVNCQMKYLGCRNYFNQKRKYCQKIPHCISDPEKELPDLAYIPLSNKCRDLIEAISKNDLKQLEQGVMVGKTWEKMGSFPVVSTNFRCHHGKIDNITGFCICNDGWTSVPFTKENYEPTLSPYHMCNIRVGTWHEMNEEKFKMTILIIALCAVSTTITILISAFCMNLLYDCIKSFESRDSEGHERNITYMDDQDESNHKEEPTNKKIEKKPTVNSMCNTKSNHDHKNSKYSTKAIIRTTRQLKDSACICIHGAQEKCLEQCPEKKNKKVKYKLSSATTESSQLP